MDVASQKKGLALLKRIDRNFDLAIRAIDRAWKATGNTPKCLAERAKAKAYVSAARSAEDELLALIERAQ